MMRVIVTGAVAWTNTDTIRKAFATLPSHTTIIHGDSPGLDMLAAEVGRSLGFKVESFRKSKADYKVSRKGAWKNLHARMLAGGVDLVLAFHSELEVPNKARGTRHMIGLAEAQNIPVQRFLN